MGFDLTPEQLGLWDENMRFVQEPGEFRVEVGNQSAVFTLVKK